MVTASSKVINDPVHGFISIPQGLVRSLLEQPEVQRLRHLRQLGMAELVYPGATHTRLLHSIGAMHLMGAAIRTLREKGATISPEEEEATLAAILLHDIGHAPLSHTLEGVLLPGISHEQIGLALIRRLNENEKLRGRLELTLRIMEGRHEKRYLQQLVCGQLDVDRLDYLERDSFFTGVREGLVASDRIIKMLTLHEGRLAVERKGLYSLEHFLMARRVMYWQVYLHKTVVVADSMLRSAFLRARTLVQKGQLKGPNDPLMRLLREQEGTLGEETLALFLGTNDSMAYYALARWAEEEDPLLSLLSRAILRRELLRLRYLDQPMPPAELEALRANYATRHPNLPEEVVQGLIFTGTARHSAYQSGSESLILINPNGSTTPLEALWPQISASEVEAAHYLCEPKGSGR